jgi:hypothetical protein
VILRLLARRWHAGEENESTVPYGPPGRPRDGARRGGSVISEVVAGILIAVLAIYAIFAGADFGGGLWDLLAGGDHRGRPARQLIDETITPVWEANHVWLIFALVIFWSAFPTPSPR